MVTRATTDVASNINLVAGNVTVKVGAFFKTISIKGAEQNILDNLSATPMPNGPTVNSDGSISASFKGNVSFGPKGAYEADVSTALSFKPSGPPTGTVSNNHAVVADDQADLEELAAVIGSAIGEGVPWALQQAGQCVEPGDLRCLGRLQRVGYVLVEQDLLQVCRCVRGTSHRTRASRIDQDAERATGAAHATVAVVALP
jgi:hypothetical protein